MNGRAGQLDGCVRDWMRARCSSLEKNWRSSALSLSLSFSRSDESMLKSVEDMVTGSFGDVWNGMGGRRDKVEQAMGGVELFGGAGDRGRAGKGSVSVCSQWESRI